MVILASSLIEGRRACTVKMIRQAAKFLCHRDDFQQQRAVLEHQTKALCLNNELAGTQSRYLNFKVGRRRDTPSRPDPGLAFVNVRSLRIAGLR